MKDETSMILFDAQDTHYPNTGYSNLRTSVRALVFKDNQCAFLHIKTHDVFGPRDHFEIPGGGIEKGEDHHDALQREIKEEIGCNVSIKDYLGLYIERLNVLERISFHHYYVCEFLSQESSDLTDYEKDVFAGIQWRSVDVWLEILNQPVSGVNHLIHQREIIILQEYLNQNQSK